MVSLFDKANKMKNSDKPMSINHQEFLKRIKKSFYYGPSNPNRMTSQPMASTVASSFNESHRNYSLNTLDLDTISRIRQQTPCSLILSMIYLERLNSLDPAFVKLVSPSELFLVTLMVSTKFYNDYDETDVFTSAWAEEGRVDAERLKQLEVAFLNAIQWNILVGQKEFYEKLKAVERLLAMKEGLARGWFTYTELELLMPSLHVAKQILNYASILMFSYACSIATIALSSLILSTIPTATDLAAPSNITGSSVVLLPTLHDPTDEPTFDLQLQLKDSNPSFTRNFSTFPLFDHFMHWDTHKVRHDVPNFQLIPKKFEPMPLPW